MYQSVMIPGSSALHGDWAALDDQVLKRCRNPLHDRHALPKAAYADEDVEQFPFLAERFALWAFDEYCAALGNEPISDEQATSEMLEQSGDSPPLNEDATT
jgi:hypothetical protein